MKSFLQFFTDLFRVGPKYNSIEAYIAAGNPQTPADVERLEQEFTKMYQSTSLYDRYY